MSQPQPLSMTMELTKDAFNDLYNKMPKDEKWLLIWTSMATMFARRLGGKHMESLNGLLSQYLIDCPPPDFFVYELVAMTAAERDFDQRDNCQKAADALLDELGLPPLQWRN